MNQRKNVQLILWRAYKEENGDRSLILSHLFPLYHHLELSFEAAIILGLCTMFVETSPWFVSLEWEEG